MHYVNITLYCWPVIPLDRVFQVTNGSTIDCIGPIQTQEPTCIVIVPLIATTTEDSPWSYAT